MRYFSKFKVQNLQSDIYSSRVVEFEIMHGALLNIEPKIIFDKQGQKFAYHEKEARAILRYMNEIGHGKANYELMTYDPKPHFRSARV